MRISVSSSDVCSSDLVPYKGSGPALADVLAGHVPFGVFGLSSTLSHIREGSLKAYGVFEAQRSSLDPNILTMSEAGVKDAAAPLIYTILAPAGTPQPVVDTQIGRATCRERVCQ